MSSNSTRPRSFSQESNLRNLIPFAKGEHQEKGEHQIKKVLVCVCSFLEYYYAKRVLFVVLGPRLFRSAFHCLTHVYHTRLLEEDEGDKAEFPRDMTHFAHSKLFCTTRISECQLRLVQANHFDRIVYLDLNNLYDMNPEIVSATLVTLKFRGDYKSVVLDLPSATYIKMSGRCEKVTLVHKTHQFSGKKIMRSHLHGKCNMIKCKVRTLKDLSLLHASNVLHINAKEYVLFDLNGLEQKIQSLCVTEKCEHLSKLTALKKLRLRKFGDLGLLLRCDTLELYDCSVNVALIDCRRLILKRCHVWGTNESVEELVFWSTQFEFATFKCLMQYKESVRAGLYEKSLNVVVRTNSLGHKTMETTEQVNSLNVVHRDGVYEEIVHRYTFRLPEELVFHIASFLCFEESCAFVDPALLRVAHNVREPFCFNENLREISADCLFDASQYAFLRFVRGNKIKFGVHKFLSRLEIGASNLHQYETVIPCLEALKTLVMEGKSHSRVVIQSNSLLCLRVMGCDTVIECPNLTHFEARVCVVKISAPLLRTYCSPDESSIDLYFPCLLEFTGWCTPQMFEQLRRVSTRLEYANLSMRTFDCNEACDFIKRLSCSHLCVHLPKNVETLEIQHSIGKHIDHSLHFLHLKKLNLSLQDRLTFEDVNFRIKLHDCTNCVVYGAPRVKLTGKCIKNKITAHTVIPDCSDTSEHNEIRCLSLKMQTQSYSSKIDYTTVESLTLRHNQKQILLLIDPLKLRHITTCDLKEIEFELHKFPNLRTIKCSNNSNFEVPRSFRVLRKTHSIILLGAFLLGAF